MAGELTVLSVLICGLGLVAGVSNMITMTYIALTRMWKPSFGKLLFNMAVAGSRVQYFRHGILITSSAAYRVGQ